MCSLSPCSAQEPPVALVPAAEPVGRRPPAIGTLHANAVPEHFAVGIPVEGGDSIHDGDSANAVRPEWGGSPYAHRAAARPSLPLAQMKAEGWDRSTRIRARRLSRRHALVFVHPTGPIFPTGCSTSSPASQECLPGRPVPGCARSKFSIPSGAGSGPCLLRNGGSASSRPSSYL